MNLTNIIVIIFFKSNDMLSTIISFDVVCVGSPITTVLQNNKTIKSEILGIT